MLGEIPRKNSGLESLGNRGRERMSNLLSVPKFEILQTQKATAELASLPKDEVVSIVSSPKKPIENTFDFLRVLNESGRNYIPHIATRHLIDSEHVVMIMGKLQELNVKEIFLIAGDNPEPAGRFKSSSDLLKELRKQNISFEKIGVAGYPRGHNKISNEILDEALLEKEATIEEMGASMHIVTQMCFDLDGFVNWVEKIRKMGVKSPIVFGVPGSASAKRIFDFACEAGLDDAIEYFKENFSESINLGISSLIKNYDPKNLLIDLSRKISDEHKVEGIHFFTFNAINSTAKWLEDFKKSL